MTVLPENRIVLAPLAGGPSTPELAAAVAEAGGLPFLGAGYLTAAALAEQLEATRALTDAPFGVNIFVLRDRPVDAGAVAAYVDELQPEAARLGVPLGEPRFDDDGFDAKLAVALEAGVAVVSFTFGCPDQADIARIRAAGSETWLTVTSLAEAQAADQAGADALVVQGAEAGGHRGSWEDTDDDAVPLQELLRATAARGRLTSRRDGWHRRSRRGAGQHSPPVPLPRRSGPRFCSQTKRGPASRTGVRSQPVGRPRSHARSPAAEHAGS